MSTTEWAKNPQTNAPRSITEPAAPEPLGDSEGTATQVAVGPVNQKNFDRIWLQTCGDSMSEWYGEITWCQDKIHDDDVEYVSAATVEQLVQERGDCRALVQSLYEVLGQKKDQLAAMTKKADGFFDALQLAAKINAEGQAREQQLREALEICKKEMQGDKWDALYIDGVLAFPQDDTALRQWGAKLLEESANESEAEGWMSITLSALRRKATKLREGKK